MNVARSDEILLTTSDAAKLLDVSADWVRRLSRAGTLRTLRTVKGQRLFRREDVEKLIAERKANPPQPGRPRTPPGERPIPKKVQKKTKKGET